MQVEETSARIQLRRSRVRPKWSGGIPREFPGAKSQFLVFPYVPGLQPCPPNRALDPINQQKSQSSEPSYGDFLDEVLAC
jgi:hypothetical protein